VRRVLAVLGAVGMVVAAIVVRQAIDDEDDTGSDGPAGDEQVVVVCDPDLLDACRALGDQVQVLVEDSATASAAIVADDLAGVDGWVTSAAWLEVTENRADGDVGEAVVLAASPVVLAAVADRAEALTVLCAGAPAWRCVGDEAGQAWDTLGGDALWGSLRTGLPDADTAVGLSVLASVAAGFFDGTDFAANDFDDLRSWLSTLAEASAPGDRDLVRTLVRVGGTYSAGGLVEAQASDRPELRILAAEPSVDAVAVLVDLPGGDAIPAVSSARDALAATGWDTGEGEPRPLLKPGVMAALHTLWKDVTS
jgi:hypothetical protein